MLTQPPASSQYTIAGRQPYTFGGGAWAMRNYFSNADTGAPVC